MKENARQVLKSVQVQAQTLINKWGVVTDKSGTVVLVLHRPKPRKEK